MKNKDILFDVIGETDDTLIPELSVRKKKSGIIRLAAFGGTVCAAALICGILLLPKTPRNTDYSSLAESAPAENAQSTKTEQTAPLQETAEQHTAAPDATQEMTLQQTLPDTSVLVPENIQLAAAVYPDIPPYPERTPDGGNWSDTEPLFHAWQDACLALRDQPQGYQDGFDAFFTATAREFLKDANTENRIYSPLSLYMALGMTAEITDGNSRQQILNVLAQKDIETLRSHAKSVWLANYMDDGAAKCLLATSLWMNRNFRCYANTVQTLADTYYSSVFSGDPASDAYNKVMQEWLSTQTDGLLDAYVRNLKMDEQTVLNLASAVNYSGKWLSRFDPAKTKPGPFHAPEGILTCDFMHAKKEMQYFRGEQFTAVSLGLQNNGYMRLILPDRDSSPDELLRNDSFMQYLCTNESEIKRKYAQITLSVPKFDISSGTDLRDGLKALGITDVFDDSISDFSPLTDDTDRLFISSAEQDARIMIDEEGCRAAAITVLSVAATAMPSEQISFILDRPFLFEIMSESGMPLFIGVVNHPQE